MYGSTKAALDRFSPGVAAETYGEGISVNVLSSLAAIGTPNVRASGWIPDDLFEPVETMVEAVLAILIGDPLTRTGQDVFSIELLHELRRPVYDVTGTELVAGWQPDELPRYMAARAESVPLGYDGQSNRG